MTKDLTKQTDSDPHSSPPKQFLELDLPKYAEHLAEMDLTEEERFKHLVEACKIAQCFVDLGFPVMPPAKTCGQNRSDSGHALSEQAESDVPSLNSLIEEFEDSAPGRAARKARAS